jgi:16S rRNA (guanine(966)-N(2))-methyltransferase RsmD
VRVISGKAKGRKLQAPRSARPLTDRVKEALFNILQERTAGSFFLDLFAGSGAVGIEALSRGAQTAILVERDRHATKVIEENLKTTGLTGLAEVYQIEVDPALNLLARRGQKFDIIFLGAPYDSPALNEALARLGESELLAPTGWIVAEHRKQHQLPDRYGSLKAFREAKYGETVLTFYENGTLSGQL